LVPVFGQSVRGTFPVSGFYRADLIRDSGLRDFAPARVDLMDGPGPETSQRYEAIVLAKAVRAFATRSGMRRISLSKFFGISPARYMDNSTIRNRTWDYVTRERIYFKIALWHQDNNFPLPSLPEFIELRPKSGRPCQHLECD
jgi:hypothetical protein